MTSITQWFLVPVSTDSARNARCNDLPFVYKRWRKPPRGTSRKIGWECAACFLKPLPYFRPKSVIFPTPFQTWSKIWYPTGFRTWSPGARHVTRARDKLLWHIHGWRKHYKRNGLIIKWWRSSFFKKTYPIQDWSAQTIPYFRPNWLKLIPYFRPKRLKYHTLWHRTFLYSLVYIHLNALKRQNSWNGPCRKRSTSFSMGLPIMVCGFVRDITI